MFNKQPYNRGKFNVSSSGASPVTGLAQLNIGTTPTISGKEIYQTVLAPIKSDSDAVSTLQLQDFGTSDLIMGTFANATIEILEVGIPARMQMTTSAMQSLGDEESIHLDGLQLRPGQELVINTTDMTITVDGQNAMMYFDKYSNFFELLSGANFIEYRDEVGARKVIFDVLWKDRWL